MLSSCLKRLGCQTSNSVSLLVTVSACIYRFYAKIGKIVGGRRVPFDCITIEVIIGITAYTDRIICVYIAKAKQWAEVAWALLSENWFALEIVRNPRLIVYILLFSFFAETRIPIGPAKEGALQWGHVRGQGEFVLQSSICVIIDYDYHNGWITIILIIIILSASTL